MNKKEFLKQSDKNILALEFDDTMFEGNRIEKTVLLNIGLSKKDEEDYLENLTIEEINNPKITFQQFEIMLTKEDLKFMLNNLDK